MHLKTLFLPWVPLPFGGEVWDTSYIVAAYSSFREYCSTTAKFGSLAKSKTSASVRVLLDKNFTHFGLGCVCIWCGCCCWCYYSWTWCCCGPGCGDVGDWSVWVATVIAILVSIFPATAIAAVILSGHLLNSATCLSLRHLSLASIPLDIEEPALFKGLVQYTYISYTVI